MTFDGFLTGGGATWQIGLKDLQEVEGDPLITFWHPRWTNDGLRKVEVKREAPGGQARLEA